MSSGDCELLSPQPSNMSVWVNPSGGFSTMRTGYGISMAYDPTGKKLYYIGDDHAVTGHLLEYNENTNSCTDHGTVTAFDPSYHGWDHITWNTTSGQLWHRQPGTQNIYRWNGGSSWTGFATGGFDSYADTVRAMKWFPELGEFILVGQKNLPNGEVIGWDPDSQVTTVYSSALTDLEDTLEWCSYSRGKALMWFGGGTPNWTLSSSGTVATRDAAPFSLGVGNAQGLMFENPTNGNFIAADTDTDWYDFNPTAGTGSQWTARGGTLSVLTAPNHIGSAPAFGVVVATIHAYNVVVFVKAVSSASTPEFWVFKP
jgi:hypothetical protein